MIKQDVLHKRQQKISLKWVEMIRLLHVLSFSIEPIPLFTLVQMTNESLCCDRLEDGKVAEFFLSSLSVSLQ
jgi:hypothetical protein